MASIVETVSFLVTLAFAAPMALMGATMALGGDPLGWLFLVLAALFVGLQQWLTTPQDLPGMVAKRVAGTVVEDGDRRGEREE